MGVGFALLGGAALASITLAQVAITVAVIGTALSVAGMITQNKTLQMIGMGLSIAGGVGAAFAPAATVSSLFGGAATETASTMGAAGASNVIAGANATNVPITAAVEPVGLIASTTNANSATMGASEASHVISGANATNATPTALGVPKVLASNTDALVNPLATQAKSAAQGVKAPLTPTPTPTGGTPGVPGGAPGVGGTNLGVGGASGNKIIDAFNALDSNSKFAIANGFMQVGGSALGGIFQAESANKQLEFQKFVNAQNAAFKTQSMAPAGIISYAHPTATPTP